MHSVLVLYYVFYVKIHLFIFNRLEFPSFYKLCIHNVFLCYSSFFGTNTSHYASHAHSPTEAKSGYPYLGQLGGMDMGRVH